MIPQFPRAVCTLVLFLAACIGLVPHSSSAEILKGAHVDVELVSEGRSITRAAPFFLGVRMKPEPQWHVYWKNAGDSGSAPKFSWGTGNTTLTPVMHWAFPERIPVGPLMNYGYGEEVLFAAEFPSDFFSLIPSDAVSVDIRVVLEWLVCKEECIPGEGELSITLPIKNTKSEPDPRWSGLFERTRARWPTHAADIPMQVRYDEDKYLITFTPPWKAVPQNLQLAFFPEEGDVIENAAPQEVFFDGAQLSLILKKDTISETIASQLRGIIVSNIGWTHNGAPQALAIDAVVSGAPPPVPQRSPETTPAPLQGSLGLLSAMLFAFLGGLILNIMPCVFPVLSIKLLGFAEEAGRSPRHALIQGLLFGVGVIGTFWILALILLVLRGAGHSLGWGFQLQSPEFVFALILLLTALSLNLLGVFELGARVQHACGTIQTGEGPLGAIGSGLLAVLLATPCTAPFMGSALAFALTVSWLEGLLVFTALGLGMALPYVLLCAMPGLIRILPRPGTWMVTFKHLMAFPLFATVIWLLWVLGIQTGVEGVIGCLVALLLLALGLWILGVWAAPHRTRKSRVCAQLVCLGSIAFAIYAGATAILVGQETPTEVAQGAYIDRHGQRWEKYSEAQLASLRAQGRTIFVDFTAAWCITCQVNKRVVFSSDEVRTLIREKNIALLRADWTNKDEEISRSLERFGRQGVPLNIIYPPHSTDAEVRILPSILTPGIVLEALNQVSD